VDGGEEEIDLIIWATGYELDFPGVPAEVLSSRRPTDDLLANVLHRRYQSLYVMGLFETDGGAYPVVSRQAELVARAIRAREEGGREARWLEQRLREPAPPLSGGIRYIASPRHAISVQYEAYMRHLARLMRGLSPALATTRAS
jgi:hypothetical protein